MRWPEAFTFPSETFWVWVAHIWYVVGFVLVLVVLLLILRAIRRRPAERQHGEER